MRLPGVLQRSARQSHALTFVKEQWRSRIRMRHALLTEGAESMSKFAGLSLSERDYSIQSNGRQSARGLRTNSSRGSASVKENWIFDRPQSPNRQPMASMQSYLQIQIAGWIPNLEISIRSPRPTDAGPQSMNGIT
jgi:hypothetical protein